MSSDSSGVLALQTGANSTAMTLDASGNVGIGTASPTNRLTVNGGTGSTPTIRLNGGTAADDNALISSKYNLVLGCNADGNIGSRAITFVNSTTENMRIDSSGNLLVGTTSQTPGYGNTNTGVQIGASNQVSTFSRSQTDFVIVSNQNTIDGSTYYQMQFRVSNVSKGSITSTSSATAYNTSSDYRLKENIAPMTGALAKVAQLKPVIYKWKIDGSDGEGFIAHELAEVKPDCVTGEKDAVDENGDIKPQGIDVSFLVATLTAAIQEQQALIVDLQARLAKAGL
jgi:hypothetical protein